jgi:hypothetical protein
MLVNGFEVWYRNLRPGWEALRCGIDNIRDLKPAAASRPCRDGSDRIIGRAPSEK